jgi:hypothetical protein
MLQVMKLHTYIHSCGHLTTRLLPRSAWVTGAAHSRLDYPCGGCVVHKAREEYMRELEVKAAFNSECG